MPAPMVRRCSLKLRSAPPFSESWQTATYGSDAAALTQNRRHLLERRVPPTRALARFNAPLGRTRFRDLYGPWTGMKVR